MSECFQVIDTCGKLDCLEWKIVRDNFALLWELFYKLENQCKNLYGYEGTMDAKISYYTIHHVVACRTIRTFQKGCIIKDDGLYYEGVNIEQKAFVNQTNEEFEKQINSYFNNRILFIQSHIEKLDSDNNVFLGIG